MKSLIIGCSFSLLFSTYLGGQVQDTTTVPGINIGLQKHLNSFTEKHQKNLHTAELSFYPDNFHTAILNQLSQKHVTTDHGTDPFIKGIKLEVVPFYLGQEAYLSPKDAQKIWNAAVSPFNPEHLLVGSKIEGSNFVNNFPVLIIRPKIGAFLNEKLLFNWD
ncbi:MAG: hypothetical protein Sapg2KO_32270 [Saprospiraceae bacterium]